MKYKYVLIDFSIFLHKAVFINSKNPAIPPMYTCLSMIIACLKHLDLGQADRIIVAMDGRNNWRKTVDKNYKANRKEIRDKSEIDWPHWFKQFDAFVEKLKRALPFIFIQIDTLEADDIIATACKLYKDSECIILSSDSDFEQLYALPNVKIFSPISKKFKVVSNPYKLLSKKIDKEKTDNLVTDVLDEADFDTRYMLVNLINLPSFVESKALDILTKIEYNIDYDLNYLPFKSLRERFIEIYIQKKESKKKCIESSKKVQKEICSNLPKKGKTTKKPHGIF